MSTTVVAVSRWRATCAQPHVIIGSFLLDVAARILTCHDQRVPLRSKEMELFTLLATSFPQTVSRDAIMGALWREGASDTALSQLVYRLRRDLAAFDPSFEYVRTVSGYGFRLAKPFEQPVVPDDDADPEVFRLHQRAVFLLRARREESVLESITVFEQALGADSGFSPAMLGLARAYINAGTRLLIEPARAYERAHAILTQALERDPRNGEAYALASVLEIFFVGVTARAMELLEHARALKPEAEATYAALIWNAIGRTNIPQSIAYAQQVLRLNPASANLTTLAGHAFYLDGRYDRAHAYFVQALEFQPDYAPAIFYDACTACLQGDYAEALSLLGRIRGRDMEARALAVRAIAQTGLGNERESARTLAKMECQSVPSDLSRAAVYFALDDEGRALQLLDSSIRRNEPARFLALVDPFYRRFDPVRHAALAERLVAPSRTLIR